MESFQKKAGNIPHKPGVYRFLDESGDPLYIGKAKDLKKRVSSYFRNEKERGPRIRKMLEKARDLEWTETNSEVEALVLEDNLIKEHQPKFNVLLRDDKHFQYIKVSVQDDYPEVYTVRKIDKDGARYFGPKTNGSDVKQILDTVKRIFRLCSVRNISLDPKGIPLKGAKVAVKVGGSAAKRPCLDYHIKRCVGPCAGMVTPEEYRERIDRVLEFLEGDYKPAISALKQQMADFAAERKFERAAKVRDEIEAIRRTDDKQLVLDTQMADRDVIGFVSDLGKSFFNLFRIRNGKLIDQENFIAEGDDDPVEILESFTREYYGLAADFPEEVLVPIELPDARLLQDYLKEQAGRRVVLAHPQAGKKDDLVALAEKNARSFAERNRARWMAEKRGERALPELRKALGLDCEPKRIECYDISHLSGTETVGSMVVFKKGEPIPADYRQFRLKTTEGAIDDLKSIAEVLRRRLTYLPAKLPEGYTLEKAKKADTDFVRALYTDPPDFSIKQFYVIRKGKKIVCAGRVHELSGGTHRVAGLWVSEKERGKKLGHILMRKLIESSKQKRLYLTCRQDLETYYLKMGWETLRQGPEDLRVLAKEHDFGRVFMAFQKKKKDLSFESVPDLIVIDGGKGQLHSAHEVLFEKGLAIPMISLAKRLEEVFVPGRSEPLNLPSNTEASYLLQRIRDEAHRFAIEHNRASRDRKMTKSALDEIPGVGPKTRQKLLTYFGSAEKVREAPQAVLEQIVGELAARAIREGL